MRTNLLAWCFMLILAVSAQAAPQVQVIIAGSKSDKSKLDTPFGIAFDSQGIGYINEFDGGRVYQLDKLGTLTLLGGNPGDPATRGKPAPQAKAYTGDGGPVAKATFNGMHTLAVTPEGDIYLADTWNNVIRKIDRRTGIVTTFAGTGEKGFAGDNGPAEKAQFHGVFCISFSPDFARLIVADLGNKRIRAIDMKTAIVTTIAGNGMSGKPADGDVAIDSPLADPRAAASDRQGNVYILERNGHALRVVSPDGKIKTVCGGSGKKGASDGDVAASTMNGPKHLCVDLHDNVIIADAENNLLRKYDAKTGNLTTLAIKNLARPHGLAVHADGTLYIADSYNNRVLKATGW